MIQSRWMNALAFGAALVLQSQISNAADVWGLKAGTPDLQSATTLAFGPEDILFVGDAKGAAVFAIATGNTAGDASKLRSTLMTCLLRLAMRFTPRPL